MDSTLLKGLLALETIAGSDTPRGVTELAEQLHLTKSNVHRILKTLETAGYLNRDEITRRYSLSLKLWELGFNAVSKLDVRMVATSHMQVLSDLTKETVHLSLLDGADVIYIDKVNSPEPVQAYSFVGGRAPAHCVATGKAMLASMSSVELDARSRKLQAYSERTITNRTRFLEEMEKIREQGFAVNLGEWRESVWGVAAVIRDAHGEARAAVGISGPKFRLEKQGIEMFIAPVMEAARNISRQLGYREHLVAPPG